MVFMLALLGVDTIREFAFPLMAGIIAGAWSSVCITGGFWHVLESKFKRTESEEGEWYESEK